MTLTPYDKGDRLEPKPWVTSTAGLTATNADEFGRVDFDDDGGTTIIPGLYVERAAGEQPDSYVLHYRSGDNVTIVDDDAVEPDFDTIERTVWRGQRLVDLGADDAEEDNDDYAGHLTQASDVLADLLGWAHQHGIPSDVLFDKAYTAHVEELKDLGLEPVE